MNANNIKKKIALLLCMLIICTTLPVRASKNYYKSTDFIISTIEENLSFTKIKFENKITGNIEYLTILNNLNEKTVMISNEESKNVEIMKQSDFEGFGFDKVGQLNINQNKNDISPNAYGPWGDSEWQYSSKHVDYRNYANLVAAILLITGASGASAAVLLIADYCVNNHVSQVYYKRKTQYRFDNQNKKYQGKTTTLCYNDSGYRNYINTVVHTWTGDAVN